MKSKVPQTLNYLFLRAKLHTYAILSMSAFISSLNRQDICYITHSIKE